MAHYIHSIPGRLRVKIAKVKSRPGTVEALEGLLGCLHGIDTVSINPLTANALITYCPKTIQSHEILDMLRRKGFLEVADPGSDEGARMPVFQTRQALGRALFGWAVGRALEGTGLSFLAALI